MEYHSFHMYLDLCVWQASAMCMHGLRSFNYCTSKKFGPSNYLVPFTEWLKIISNNSAKVVLVLVTINWAVMILRYTYAGMPTWQRLSHIRLEVWSPINPTHTNIIPYSKAISCLFELQTYTVYNDNLIPVYYFIAPLPASPRLGSHTTIPSQTCMTLMMRRAV